MLTIRLATKQDAALLTEIQKSAFLPLYNIYHDSSNPYFNTQADTLKKISSAVYTYWCILEGSSLVGGICYKKISGEEYYLQRLFIHPDVQSKGYAACAILLCEKELCAKRYTLDFPVDRIMNQRCYEKAGFKDTGERIKITDRLSLSVYEKIV